MLVRAVDRPEVPPIAMPERFRTEIAYFITPAGEQGVAKLPSGHYWIRLAEATKWLAEGVVPVVSPLDSLNRTELELSEEQEQFLEWLVRGGIEHVAVE